VEWRPGPHRLALRVAVILGVETIGLWAMGQALPGLRVRDWGTAIAAIGIIAALNAVIRPILLYLAISLTVLSFGLFTFLLNAALLLATARLQPRRPGRPADAAVPARPGRLAGRGRADRGGAGGERPAGALDRGARGLMAAQAGRDRPGTDAQ